MTGRRDSLNRIERLLGLPPLGVRAVERRRDGSYAIELHRLGSSAALDHGVPRWATSKRVLRIPHRRVEGYRPSSPHVTPHDQRARRKANARRFAWWLLWRLGHDAPVVDRAIFRHDLAAIDELRAALIAAAPPEPEPVLALVFVFGMNGGEQAA